MSNNAITAKTRMRFETNISVYMWCWDDDSRPVLWQTWHVPYAACQSRLEVAYWSRMALLMLPHLAWNNHTAATCIYAYTYYMSNATQYIRLRFT
jgi:hypothetical protein